MSLGDLPMVGMLKMKMRWHQARQQVLADNVANADTPSFRPRELEAFGASSPLAGLRPVAPTITQASHIAAAPLSAGQGAFGARDEAGWETKPGGNAVVLEDEMMKVAENQFDYQLASTLYSRSLGLIRSALGKQA